MRLDEVDDDLNRLENIVASLMDTLRRELVYEDREAARVKFEHVDASFRRHIKKGRARRPKATA